jgi:tetratricopeptide (TPR) repeat protein
MREKGRYKEALAAFRDLENHAESSFDLANLISDQIGCQLFLGDIAGARANLLRLEPLASDEIIRGIYLFTGSCVAHASGDYKQAVEGFRKCLDLAPSNPDEEDRLFLQDLEERLSLAQLCANKIQ